jgi:hypothetical protein
MLSADKAATPAVKALDYLVQRFAVDPATKWRRVYELGNKSQMLVVVRQEAKEQPVRVDIITDVASEVMLHWGVAKHGAAQAGSMTWVLWICILHGLGITVVFGWYGQRSYFAFLTLHACPRLPVTPCAYLTGEGMLCTLHSRFATCALIPHDLEHVCRLARLGCAP